MSQNQIDILQRALQREKLARKQAEKILEEKSLQLYNTAEELKHANEKLEGLLDEKTTQLQGIFENINDAYLVMDLKGNVIKMNDAAVELFGYDIANESINVIKLIYKEDYTYAMESFMELGNKGYFSDYTARVYTKEKAIKWIHINASIVYNKQKQPIAAQGIIRDITESKFTAELIEEQRAQLDIIVENAPFGIALTQFGKIVKTNKAFQNSLGFREQELEEITVKDISVAEDFPESKAYIDKMDAGEIDNFVVDKRYRKKDGSIIWAKTSVNAVRDQIGKIKYQVALIEDITSQREKALIINMINEVAKSVLGKMNIYEIAWEIVNSIAKFLGTEDCVIYLVNERQKTIEQIAAFGDKVDKNSKIVNTVVLPFGSGIVGRVAQTGVAEIINDTSKDAAYVVDGERRNSEITIPILNNGEVIGIIDAEHKSKNYFNTQHLKTIQNIASLVAMQLKSAINLRAREKVEAKNDELLLALAKSNDELQEYAHIVSLDLKSPLRSINALTAWIKEDNKGQLDEASLQNFGLIETTLEKMEQLITDILEYSSVGSNDYDLQDVNLNEVVVELKQVLFVPEHISIQILKTLPEVKGDKTKLKQVFQNLISNAIKFNDKAKGIIEIDYLEHKSYYQFSVKDNGVGIELKYHDKIFKIFHALNKSKNSTGIGLSIVKKVIDLYQGEIWVESELTKGTTFHFTIKK
jgi:PAS domain S-box-containing protein